MSSEAPSIPNIQKERVIEYLKQGKRFDGRGPEDFRDIEIKMNISNKAEGSCSVKIGKTEVYAGVKMDVTEPYPDNPSDGNFMASVELSPMASPEFENGPPKIDAIEIGRVVDRGLRESGFIEFNKLCIKEGEKVWQIFLDIYAVNDDGNLVDAAYLAGLIALAHAHMPLYDEATGKVNHEKLSDKKLPLSKEFMALNLTAYRIGDVWVFNPSREEEKCANCRISFAMSSNNGEPRICACQKGQESPIGFEEMQILLDLIDKNWKKMYPKVVKYVFESK